MRAAAMPCLLEAGPARNCARLADELLAQAAHATRHARSARSVARLLRRLRDAMGELVAWADSSDGAALLAAQLVIDWNNLVTCCRVLADVLGSGLSDLTACDERGGGWRRLVVLLAFYEGLPRFRKVVRRLGRALEALRRACERQMPEKQELLLQDPGIRGLFAKAHDDCRMLLAEQHAPELLRSKTRGFSFSQSVFSRKPIVRTGQADYDRTAVLDHDAYGKIRLGDRASGAAAVLKHLATGKPAHRASEEPLGRALELGRMAVRTRQIDRFLAGPPPHPTPFVVYCVGFHDQVREFVSLLRVEAAEGFSDQELEELPGSVVKAAAEAAMGFIDLLGHWGVKLEDRLDFKLLNQSLLAVHEGDRGAALASLQPLLPAIQELWDSSEALMRKAHPRSRGMLFEPRWCYFLPEIQRFFRPGFVPSEADVFNASSGRHPGHFVDLQLAAASVCVCTGFGCCSGVRKLVPLGADASAMVFSVDLAWYAMTLCEDRDANRLSETFALFDSVAGMQRSLQTTIVLLLTNFQRFSRMLSLLPFSDFVPEYCGENEPHAAVRYVVDRLGSMNRHSTNILPILVDDFGRANRKGIAHVFQQELLQNVVRR